MGLARLIERARPSEEERAAPFLDNQFIYALPGGWGLTAAAYTQVNGVEDALKNAATYACVRVMTDALSRTPIDVVREVKGVNTIVNPLPRVIGNPSPLVTPDVWRTQFAFSMMTDGNVFATVLDSDTAGRPTSLELLDPFTVADRQIVTTKQGKVPKVRIGQQEHFLWPYGDVWHCPGDLVQPGTVFAASPVMYASKLIGTSLAAEDFSYRFFADGGHPPYLLKNANQAELTQEQADKAKTVWRRATVGSREPAVMGSAWSIEQFGIDPNETQFIDLMRFCTEQACRVFGVPPTMIFASVTGQHMTYANVTQADLHFLKHALEGKFVRIESALTNILPGNAWSAPSSPNTKAVMRREAILKADVAARYAAYAIGLTNRFLAINEVRAAEDEPPFDGPEFNLPGVPPFGPTPDPLGVDLAPSAPAPSPSDDIDDPVAT